MNINSLNISYSSYSKHVEYTPAQRYNFINFKSNADVFKRSTKALTPLFDIEASKSLVDIFNKNFNKMPKGLNLTLSQTNNSVLSFFREIDENTVLKAIKKAAVNKKNEFFYIVFKEFENNALKNTFAVDMRTGELIKLNSEEKAVIVKNELVKYKENPADKNFIKYCQKIKQYANLVYGKTITQAEKISDENCQRQWHIDKTNYATLSEKVHADIVEINDLLTKISNFVEAKRGLSAKIVQLKMNYEPLIYLSRKQKNTMFKYRNLESLSVLHIKSNDRFTRIIHTNSCGYEKHLLIDGTDKIVSNLNKKRPWLTPEKYRYMTKKELEESGIESYAAFLKQQLKLYYEYLYDNIGSDKVSHRRKRLNAKDELECFMNAMNQKISKNLEEIQGDIKNYADKDAANLVSKYFQALSESMDTYAKEGLENFQRKFKKYVEEFTR